MIAATTCVGKECSLKPSGTRKFHTATIVYSGATRLRIVWVLTASWWMNMSAMKPGSATWLCRLQTSHEIENGPAGVTSAGRFRCSRASLFALEQHLAGFASHDVNFRAVYAFIPPDNIVGSRCCIAPDNTIAPNHVRSGDNIFTPNHVERCCRFSPNHTGTSHQRDLFCGGAINLEKAVDLPRFG